MSKIAKKLAIAIIVVIVTLYSSNLIFGIEHAVVASTQTGETEKNELNNAWSVAGNILDGIVGIVTWIPRALTTAVLSLFRLLIGGITAIGGNAIYDIEGIIFTDAQGKDRNNGWFENF